MASLSILVVASFSALASCLLALEDCGKMFYSEVMASTLITIRVHPLSSLPHFYPLLFQGGALLCSVSSSLACLLGSMMTFLLSLFFHPTLPPSYARDSWCRSRFFTHRSSSLEGITNQRFDYIDKPGVGNTDIIMRSLHDISEGAEVCISYFPVNWCFAERQAKLKEEYGFECKCDRCKIEEGWSDEDKAEQVDEISVEGEVSGEEDEDMGSVDEEVMDAEGDAQGSFPHAMFFVKYLCPHEGCGGTLAPLPFNEGSGVMECNVCGQLRSEEEFLQEIEEHKVSS